MYIYNTKNCCTINSMMTLALALTLIMMVFRAAAVQISRLSLHDLKRRSSSGDTVARRLFLVARYHVLAPGYLNAVAVVIFVFLAAYISANSPLTASMLWIGLMIGAFYGAAQLARFMVRPLVLVAPQYASVIIFTRKYLSPLRAVWQRYAGSSGSVKVYGREDLVDLLQAAGKAKNGGLTKKEVKMSVAALTFKDKLVRDVMTPRKVVKFVEVDQQVSTVLLNELHESGFSRFPVTSGNVDVIVGTLYLKDLVEQKREGKVSTLMSPDYFEIAPDKNLFEALGLFLKRRHHLFVVRNEFSEVVGVITIEDVLEQLVDAEIIDESDVHEDMRELALEAEPSIRK